MTSFITPSDKPDCFNYFTFFFISIIFKVRFDILFFYLFISFYREVIKWLFSAIMKSTEHGKGRETTQEREYMR